MNKGLIHSTAIIDPSAELADDVKVGPYSIIGPSVKIDAGTQVGPHVVINGCLLYTSPSPRDRTRSRMPSSA